MTEPEQQSREIIPVRSRLLLAALAFEKVLPRQGYNFVWPGDAEFEELRQAFRDADRAAEDPELIEAVRRFADGPGTGFTPTHYDPEVEDLRRFLEDRGFPMRLSTRPSGEAARTIDPAVQLNRWTTGEDRCPCCSKDHFVAVRTTRDGPIGCTLRHRMYVPEGWSRARIAAMAVHLRKLEDENAALRQQAWDNIWLRKQIRELREALERKETESACD